MPAGSFTADITAIRVADWSGYQPGDARAVPQYLAELDATA